MFASDPDAWGRPEEVVRGDDAAAFSRTLLQEAGVDLDELDRTATDRTAVDRTAIS